MRRVFENYYCIISGKSGNTGLSVIFITAIQYLIVIQLLISLFFFLKLSLNLLFYFFLFISIFITILKYNRKFYKKQSEIIIARWNAESIKTQWKYKIFGFFINLLVICLLVINSNKMDRLLM